MCSIDTRLAKVATGLFAIYCTFFHYEVSGNDGLSKKDTPLLSEEDSRVRHYYFIQKEGEYPYYYEDRYYEPESYPSEDEYKRHRRFHRRHSKEKYPGDYSPYYPGRGYPQQYSHPPSRLTPPSRLGPRPPRLIKPLFPGSLGPTEPKEHPFFPRHGSPHKKSEIKDYKDENYRDNEEE